MKVRHGSPYPLGAAWDGSGVNVEHAYASINFVTSHDGFTLHDLVICNEKHNEANGESNCYGADDDLNWNRGEEGPASAPAVLSPRSGRSGIFRRRCCSRWVCR
ncbi:MAG: hypothetical protein LC126_22190 [Bryobacterales bacterium]|nr:hypothetical protein [Bryobacterales bacterium]